MSKPEVIVTSVQVNEVTKTCDLEEKKDIKE